MNAENNPELSSLEGDMNVSSSTPDVETPDVKTPDVKTPDVKTDEQESEDKEVPIGNSSSADGMTCSEEMLPKKCEQEVVEENGQHRMDEGRQESSLKEEEDEASDEGLEEGFAEDGPHEDEEEEDEEEEEEMEDERDMEVDEEGDDLNEPQDLTLVDASFESANLPEAHTAAEVEAATYMPGGAMAPRSQTIGKFNCDICGLSCVSINVLLVHKRSHTGERPFHCTQCGASFTQKGNLLRHIKLHSGEKPFKCPMCSYACRRRDALSGHLRTHSVEKPYKCNHCGRSYKQRSSLEEHRERCHVYIQNKGHAVKEESHTSRSQMGTERAILLDRLASNVAKRKSTMPQKFTGDSGACLDLSFKRELIHHSDIRDPAQDQKPILTGSDANPAPSHRVYPISLSRNDMSNLALTNGHKLGLPPPGLPHPPPPQGHTSLDPLHNDGSHLSQPLIYGLGHLLGGGNPQNGIPHPHTQALPMSPLDALRVVRTDGEAGVVPGAVFPCGHCRVIFLDYVMFTIHMGCHGFRDPLECNVCGHRSRDRYEFSSHIARGEHRLDVK